METFNRDGSHGNRCPKLLPCTHTVCLACLEDLYHTHPVRMGFFQPYRGVQCPECRIFHNVPQQNVGNFPTNRYMLELVELKEKLANKKAELEEKTVQLQAAETTRNQVSAFSRTRRQFEYRLHTSRW